jgi:hydroxyacylglutathione hydrolase
LILRYVYNQQLAQASYLVGCAATGEALIVDPNRDIDHYIELAEREGLRITAVTETHIHADFVSGARELAARTGASLYLSDEGTPDWKYAWAADAGATLVYDGDTFMDGNIRIEVLHTPGHTPEHIAFLLTDTAGADRPMGIFTGDFVFVGDVGRPDLLERAAGFAGTMEDGARRLYRSLERLKALPDYIQVWPGHGAGSACGKALGAIPSSTVGYEKLFNWGLNVDSEEQFVKLVLDGQPEPPRYFKEMKRINRDGAAPVIDLPEPRQLPSSALEQALTEGLVVDTRPTTAIAGGYLPGTIAIPAGSSFLTWAGWLLPYDRPFALIADERDISELASELQLIGLDHISGFWSPQVIEGRANTHGSLEVIQQLTADELRQRIDAGPVQILDVRGAGEYDAGHLDGSMNIPLGYLRERLAEIAPETPIVVHCQGGLRSAIASTILAAEGFSKVRDLIGGYAAWKLAGHPVMTESRDAALVVQAV